MPIAGPLTGLVLTLGISTGVARAACTSIDQTHAQWTAILQRWVADGLVDYAGLRRDGRGALETYLAGLSGACAADYEQWTREERIAFWLNAYNAATVRLVLEHYPIASIRKIGWLPGGGVSGGAAADGGPPRRHAFARRARASHAAQRRP